MFDYSELPRRKIICVDRIPFFASCSCVKLNLNPLETYLVVVGSNKKHKGSVILAASPKMKSEFGMPCCIGVVPNMLLAKIALDVEAKQQANNTAIWTYEDVEEELWPISLLREVWVIGTRLEQRLSNMVLYGVGDIAKCDINRLEKEIGVEGSKIGSTVTPKNRSIGCSQMLRSDLYDTRDVEVAILEMCEDVARRARNKHLTGRTIHLGIRYSRKANEKGFQVAKIIDTPSNITQEIYKVCKELLAENHVKYAPVRQIAVRLSKVEPDSGVV